MAVIKTLFFSFWLRRRQRKYGSLEILNGDIFLILLHILIAKVEIFQNKLTSPGIYYTPPNNEGRLGSGGFSKVFCVVKKGEENKLLALKVPRCEESDEYKKK